MNIIRLAALALVALLAVSPAHAWKIDKNGVTQLKLDDSGNLGVGTTTPTAKLEVAGQVKITGGSPGAGKVLTSDAAGLASWQTPSGGGGAGRVIGGRTDSGGRWGVLHWNEACTEGRRVWTGNAGEQLIYICVSQ